MEVSKLKNLIKGCKNENRESQAHLFKLYSGKMFALCLYYSKNKTDAEDYLHNGFLKVFKHIKQYKGKGSFEGWMRRIFVNTILEDFRKMNIRTTEFGNESFNEYQINNDIIGQLNSNDLIQLIQELSPAYKMVFNLYAIEGYTHKEIAKMLNISEGTSKSNLARARSILQKKLKLHFQISNN